MRRAISLLAVAATLAIGAASPAQSIRPGMGVKAKPDVARSMLDRPVAELKLDKVPLADAIAFLQNATRANLHVNWKALGSVGVSKDAPVSVNLRGVPLRKALTYVLQGQGPVTWYIDDGVIEVTTQEIADKQMYTRVYSVEDLVMVVPDFYGPQFNIQQASQSGQGGGGGQSPFQQTNQQPPQLRPGQSLKDQRGKELVDLVTQTVRPDVWRANGGNASIGYFNGMLVVTAPRQVHEAIAGR
jgi:hypothetical protein